VKEAVVVGSGPNGLAGAVTLAQAGYHVTVYEASDRIGGGTRSAELTLPGLLHDECSAFHPTGVASPFLTSLPLSEHGLRWLWPPIDLAHPLDGGRAGVLSRDMAATVASLGPDGESWRRLFAPMAAAMKPLAEEVLRPVVHLPHHPWQLARFGLRAMQPATMLARRWRGDEARALFAGVAAHQMHPLRSPFSASVGLMLTVAGHAYGWPVAEGGSQAITSALASLLRKLGGAITTGTEITELPTADIVLLDVSPTAAADLVGSRLPPRVFRAYRRYRYGPAIFKLDLAVEGGIPWQNEDCARSGTVHLGGTLEEIAATEAEIAKGRMPERPFVLIGQQFLADPGRSAGDLHPVWAYAHVPVGYDGDATDAIVGQLERFAPGVSQKIRARHSRSPAQLATYNANYIGGDIATGANDLRQLLLRPRPAIDPYATGVKGVYLCSAATPPGAGVHGMCGYHAARSALAHRP
jgi:phytoene dehydrogenase-like protein